MFTKLGRITALMKNRETMMEVIVSDPCMLMLCFCMQVCKCALDIKSVLNRFFSWRRDERLQNVLYTCRKIFLTLTQSLYYQLESIIWKVQVFIKEL